MGQPTRRLVGQQLAARQQAVQLLEEQQTEEVRQVQAALQVELTTMTHPRRDRDQTLAVQALEETMTQVTTRAAVEAVALERTMAPAATQTQVEIQIPEGIPTQEAVLALEAIPILEGAHRMVTVEVMAPEQILALALPALEVAATLTQQ